jgi:long-chain acyl-CoA synthetase
MQTLIDSAAERFAASPRDHAFTLRDDDGWTEVTWRDVGKDVRAIGSALVAGGVLPGDRVGILARTRLEWVEAMLGIHAAGGVVSTLYPSNTPAQIAFILRDAGCVALYVEDEAALARVRQIRDLVPELRLVVCMDGAHTDATAWRDHLRRGRQAFASAPTALEEARDAIGPSDLAALVYTSGTTGDPKGVMLTHGNLVSVCVGLAEYLPMEDGDLQLLFLPMSHVFGMVVCLVSVHVGAPTILEPDVQRIAQTLRETRPTFMPAVPRVFEKILATAEDKARDRGPRALKVFRWAADVARRYSVAMQRGQVSAALRAQHALADRLVYRRVRDGLGGRIRAFSSGAAPLSPDVSHFFHGAGMVVLEGYGMTESAAITTVSPLDDFRLGTVGISHESLDVRIASDGEILIRGPSVMVGYWNRPEETARALVDGWLHTGDLGSFDQDGHLQITGRKKDILITAGGKNIAPARIEAMLVGASPLVRLAMLHGDRRKHCVALIELDPEALADFARLHDLPGGGPDAWLTNPRLHTEISAVLDRVNERLASFESVKRVHLLRREPSVDNGELTPSMKLRRAVISEHYKSALDAMYAPGAPIVS